jgi:hypothetical protein
MDAKEELENMQEKMKEVKTMQVTKWYCLDCEKWYDKAPTMCTEEGHEVHSKRKTVHAFRCSSCKHKHLHDHAVCAIVCPKCGKSGIWEASSVYNLKEGAEDPGLVPKAKARGDEQVNSLRYGR